MIAPDVHIELVHDPRRHRAVIGWSADPALLTVTAETLITEADRRAAQFAGLDDIAAEAERAEAIRLRRVLALILPNDEGPVHEPGLAPNSADAGDGHEERYPER